MKIPITRTELQGMPNTAWGMFYDFTMERENDAGYTPVQRSAAHCMRYFFGVQEGGHGAFFAGDAAPDKEELARALRDIDAREFVDNLLRKDLEQADNWFDENREALLEALQAYQKLHVDDFYEIIDENYSVTLPAFAFWAGAVEAAMMLALMIYFSITTPKDRLLICICFFALAALGLVLMAYAKRWRISVLKDTLTLRPVFRRKRTIHLDEISGVTEKQQGLILYTHGKRFVSVDRFDNGYAMLRAQLKVAGKMDNAPPSRFTLRQPKASIIVGFLALLLPLFVLAEAFEQYPLLQRYRPVILAASVLCGLYIPFYYLWWAVTVSEDVLILRRALRGEQEIPVVDITKAVVDDQGMVLYAQGKKVVKIPLACAGYADLVERLGLYQVPFAREGGKG